MSSEASKIFERSKTGMFMVVVEGLASLDIFTNTLYVPTTFF